VTVRQATSEDAAPIAELGLDVLRLHWESYPEVFHEPIDTTKLAPMYNERLADPLVRGFVVTDPTEAIAGYVLARVVRFDGNAIVRPAVILELDEIAAAETVRRQGIGHELLEAVRRLAVEVAATRVQLNVWEFNTVAQRFFESEGLQFAMRRMLTELH
jgi:ribosomal protein S18 acetylase RimI-like enzyme